jgi:octaprenyl-diphosphate synthase
MTARPASVPASPEPAGASPADLLRHDLQAVEETLLQSSRSEVELLSVAAHHILSAGGKRFRPQLTLLSARAFDEQSRAAVSLAAAMELIHTATLVHDDIVDNSDTRRGRATANFFWGNSASVLMGDYLVIKAFSIAADAGDGRILRLLCDTIGRMCEGEVLQLCVRAEKSLDVGTYLKIIEAKTGILMSTCCRAGALLGGAALDQIEALAQFGARVGLAFQIIDDILDYTGEKQALGKPVGSDLREAKVTLPLIYALSRAGKADQDQLEQALERSSALRPEEIAAVAQVIERYEGFIMAQKQAAAFVRDARRVLAMIPPGAPRDGLDYLAGKAIERMA